MRKLGLCAALALSMCVFSACDQQIEENEPIEGTENMKFSVSVNGESKGDFTAEDLVADKIITGEDGTRRVKISTIIEAVTGITGASLSEYYCDYEGSGGFRPSSKGEGCEARLCETSTSAYVDIDTGLMSYDDESVRGCYKVKGMTLVLMTSEQPAAGTGDNPENNKDENRSVTVNVADLSVNQAVSLKDAAKGEDKVRISDVILTAATSLTAADLSNYTCDYKSSDGKKSSDKGKCAEKWSCETALKGYLSVSGGQISYDSDVENAEGCRLWSDVVEIIVEKAN